jgi:hypothetical protein
MGRLGFHCCKREIVVVKRDNLHAMNSHASFQPMMRSNAFKGTSAAGHMLPCSSGTRAHCPTTRSTSGALPLDSSEAIDLCMRDSSCCKSESMDVIQRAHECSGCLNMLRVATL